MYDIVSTRELMVEKNNYVLICLDWGESRKKRGRKKRGEKTPLITYYVPKRETRPVLLEEFNFP